MIANEWHVSSLRQRGVLWHDMTPDDREAVVAHAVVRRVRGLDPVTRADLVELVNTTRSSKQKQRDPAEEEATTREALARMADLRAGRS